MSESAFSAATFGGMVTSPCCCREEDDNIDEDKEDDEVDMPAMPSSFDNEGSKGGEVLVDAVDELVTRRARDDRSEADDEEEEEEEAEDGDVDKGTVYLPSARSGRVCS